MTLASSTDGLKSVLLGCGFAAPRHCVPLQLLLLFSALSGCNSAEERGADVRRASYASYEEGLAALEAKQYAAAEEKFSAAIAEGGLNFDILCDAHIKRAVCRAAAGRFDEALAELQEVEDHGGDLGAVESARSYIFRKQGNEARARAAWARARQLNPLVQEFRD